jgi:hypothetical protein
MSFQWSAAGLIIGSQHQLSIMGTSLQGSPGVRASKVDRLAIQDKVLALALDEA